MNTFLTCFNELYACQGRVLGITIVATVTALDGSTIIANAQPALLSERDMNPFYGDGTTFQSGSLELKMRPADFTAPPQKNMSIACNGDATGLVLQIVGLKLVNGIYYIEMGDINSP